MSRAIRDILTAKARAVTTADVVKVCRPGVVWGRAKIEPGMEIGAGVSLEEMARLVKEETVVRDGLMSGITVAEALQKLKLSRFVRTKETVKKAAPKVYCPAPATIAYLLLHKDVPTAMERWTAMSYFDRLCIQASPEYQGNLTAAARIYEKTQASGEDFTPELLQSECSYVPGRLRGEIEMLRRSSEWRERTLYEMITVSLANIGRGAPIDDLPGLFRCRKENAAAVSSSVLQARARGLQKRLFSDPLSTDGELRAFEMLPEDFYMELVVPPQEFNSEPVDAETIVRNVAYCLSHKESLINAEVYFASKPDVDEYRTPTFITYERALAATGISSYLAESSWWQASRWVTHRVTNTDPIRRYVPYYNFTLTMNPAPEPFLASLWASLDPEEQAEYHTIGYPTEEEWMTSLGRPNNLGTLPRGFATYVAERRQENTEGADEDILPVAAAEWLQKTVDERRVFAEKDSVHGRGRIVTLHGAWDRLPEGFLVNSWTDCLEPEGCEPGYELLTDLERFQYFKNDYMRFKEAFERQTKAGYTQTFLKRFLGMSQRGVVSVGSALAGMPPYALTLLPETTPAWEILPQSPVIYGQNVIDCIEAILCVADPHHEYLSYCEENGVDYTIAENARAFLKSEPAKRQAPAESSLPTDKPTRNKWFSITPEEVLSDAKTYRCHTWTQAVDLIAEGRYPTPTDSPQYPSPDWTTEIAENSPLDGVLNRLAVDGVTEDFIHLPRGVQAAVLRKANRDLKLNLNVVVFPMSEPVSGGEELFTGWLLRGFANTAAVTHVCRALWSKMGPLERQMYEKASMCDHLASPPQNLTPELQFWWTASGHDLVMAIEELPTKPLTAFTYYTMHHLKGADLLCGSKYLVQKFAALPNETRSQLYDEAVAYSDSTIDANPVVSVTPKELCPASHYFGQTPWMQLSKLEKWNSYAKARKLKNRLSWDQQHKSRLLPIHVFLSENTGCTDQDWALLADHRKTYYERQAAIVMSEGWLSTESLAEPTTGLGVLLSSPEAAYMSYGEVERIYYNKSDKTPGMAAAVERKAAENMRELAWHGKSVGGVPAVDVKVAKMKRGAWGIGAKGLMQMESQGHAWDGAPETVKANYMRKLLGVVEYSEGGIRRGEASAEDIILLLKDMMEGCPLSPYLRAQTDVFQLLATDMRIPLHRTHHLLDKAGDGVWTYLNKRLKVNNELAKRLLGETPHYEDADDEYKERIQKILDSTVTDETKLRTLLVYLVKFSNERRRYLYNFTVLPTQELLASILAVKGIKVFKDRSDPIEDPSQVELNALQVVVEHGGAAGHSALRFWRPLVNETDLPLFEHSYYPQNRRLSPLDVYLVQPESEGLTADDIEHVWSHLHPTAKAPFLALGTTTRRGFSRFSDMIESATKDNNYTFLEKLVQKINKAMTEVNYLNKQKQRGVNPSVLKSMPSYQRYQLLKTDFQDLKQPEDVIKKLLEMEDSA
eukprot:TRINITY_DN13099_c0_g1_i2.p1 TRINITY_DN13099_c0_g1~~TRINITY_DN13099_c0_g1_i2.p1  ORF type:complete len:1459 (+),score=292.11 TRINITY_DN13099_c0_g1_i2:84-4460(+)